MHSERIGTTLCNRIFKCVHIAEIDSELFGKLVAQTKRQVLLNDCRKPNDPKGFIIICRNLYPLNIIDAVRCACPRIKTSIPTV
jgi:hypothetical protein